MTIHRCYFCKGPVEEKRVNVFRKCRGVIELIENVPAEVCTRCAQESYPGWVAHEMDRLLAEGVPDRTVSVPLFRFEKTEEAGMDALREHLEERFTPTQV